jgi:hypothetical protein
MEGRSHHARIALLVPQVLHRSPGVRMSYGQQSKRSLPQQLRLVHNRGCLLLAQGSQELIGARLAVLQQLA